MCIRMPARISLPSDISVNREGIPSTRPKAHSLDDGQLRPRVGEEGGEGEGEAVGRVLLEVIGTSQPGHDVGVEDVQEDESSF